MVACGLQDNNKYQFLCLELETLNDSLILLKACVNFIFYSVVNLVFFWLDKLASYSSMFPFLFTLKKFTCFFNKMVVLVLH